ncbi:MAG: IS630 family transposase [Gammaproteobacteria bacterium]|nr:IS630 family transposase [Gammaproteobacteria bacterium]
MEFIEQLRRNKSRGDEEQSIVYIDECGFHNNIKSEYGWSRRGDLILEDKHGRATEKLNLIAGLLNQKVIAPLMYSFYTDTEVFNLWIERCLIPELPEKCILIMDNASFHKSEETRSIIEENGHQLLFLPPYSPDLNPIENHWALLKRRLRKILPNNKSLFESLSAVFQTA